MTNQAPATNEESSQEDLSSLLNVSQKKLPSIKIALVGFGVAVLALIGVILLWQRMWLVQEQVARQSGAVQQQVTEALVFAKNAQDLMQSAQAKIAIYGAKVDELIAQRNQLEELAKSLNTSRNETLAGNVAAELQMAYQQTELTGDLTILLRALGSAKNRLMLRSDTRFREPLQKINEDISRIKTANVLDIGAALTQFDVLVGSVDSFPLANHVRDVRFHREKEIHSVAKKETDWMSKWITDFLEEIRNLVRIQKLNNSDAMLLSPEQSTIWRENLKLLLLNARLSLLTRHIVSVQGDLILAIASIRQYCDTSAKATKTALSLLEQLQYRMQSGGQVPNINASIDALELIESRQGTRG